MILAVLDSPFGGVYQSVENILTTSVTAIILLVVGYSMELNAKLLKPCIATIILRVLLQAVMIAGVLVAVHYLVGDDRLVNLAIISYMSAPATFSMQTFMKDERRKRLCFHNKLHVLSGIYSCIYNYGSDNLLIMKSE